jgi:parallel beta-helix repeat protein
VLVFNASNLTVTENRISENDDNLHAPEDAGLTPQPAPKYWVISNNDASDAVDNPVVPFGNGFGDGVDVDSTSANVSVMNNTVSNGYEFGIALYGVSRASISANNAHLDGDGLYIGGPGSVGLTSAHNSLEFNSATNN